MELGKLKEPMPFHWKVQAFYPKAEEKQGCLCVGYVDARQVMDRLDEVVGQENWQCTYSQNKNNLFCAISIRCGTSGTPLDWISKSDCGTESDMEAEKGEASDAFKRAAVRWGIGRFLYDLPEMKLKVVKQGKSYAPADDTGQAMYSKDKLTEYCNKVATRKPTKQKPAAKPIETATPATVVPPEHNPLPAMTADQKKRVGRLFKCIQDNYPNGKHIEAKDFAKAVYVILTHWPDCAADEEHILNTIKIGTQEDECGTDGKPPLQKAG